MNRKIWPKYIMKTCYMYIWHLLWFYCQQCFRFSSFCNYLEKFPHTTHLVKVNFSVIVLYCLWSKFGCISQSKSILAFLKYLLFQKGYISQLGLNRIFVKVEWEIRERKICGRMEASPKISGYRDWIQWT